MNRRFNVPRYHHPLSFSLQLLLTDNLLQKMANHDIGFYGDSFLMPFHIGAQFFLCFGTVKQRIILNRLFDLVVAFVGGVVCQHIKDKTLLNRLFH